MWIFKIIWDFFNEQGDISLLEISNVKCDHLVKQQQVEFLYTSGISV